jgi:hypothetical protein
MRWIHDAIEIAFAAWWIWAIPTTVLVLWVALLEHRQGHRRQP